MSSLPSEPPGGYDWSVDITGGSSVIVGASIRMAPGNVTTLRVNGSKIDPLTGQLITELGQPTASTFVTGGTEANRTVFETHVQGNHPIDMLTGLGIEANSGNITSLRLWTRPIVEEITFDDSFRIVSREFDLGDLSYIDFGSPPPMWEAQAILPDDFIATGIAMRANPGNITHMMGTFSYNAGI